MFQPLIEECRLRNYSVKTIKAYLFYNNKFLQFCKKRPQEITRDDLRNYLLYLDSKGCSSSMINLAHNALNFYYKTIFGRNFKPIKFQKREQKYPQILSIEEIKKLIDVTNNKKHQLMISLLYASGVRVSELVKIRLMDLDLNRKALLVRQGKGKKDRYTILSEKVVAEIRSYLSNRKEHNQYLFPSNEGHITIRTVQEVLNQARTKAKLDKEVTPHKLRHSFATHLLEAKVPESKIQKLLGHKDIKTTQIYAQVSTKNLLETKSPHDQI
ncbi:integrase [Candidatus Woesearchaeota archaeon CG_4_10_14_0_2_um_filter_33_13]|nr:MAG: integrase [Candidatus Woesearchaeota archaeon CG_4_10_14_0_2_um_filter_33_13]